MPGRFARNAGAYSGKEKGNSVPFWVAAIIRNAVLPGKSEIFEWTKPLIFIFFYII
jgi:hypothetical protein